MLLGLPVSLYHSKSPVTKLFYFSFWGEFILQVKLADKQAAVEKLQWEAMTSNKKVERLQEDLDKVQGEISSFMLLIEGLTRNDSAISVGDYDDILYHIDQNHEIVSQLLLSLLRILKFCTDNYDLETKFLLTEL